MFQVSASLEDVQIFRWNVLPRGGVRYVDARGDREFPRPASHDFEWTATTTSAASTRTSTSRT